MTECRICGRDGVENNLCEYHHMALNNLKAGFERWKEAIAGLTWKDYIERIDNLESTGQWIREIAEDIMSRDNP
jgi:hypothetical protein